MASHRVFLRGVPDGATADSIKEELSQFGQVDHVYFVKGQACGLVDFQSSAAAERVAAASGQKDAEGAPLLAVLGSPIEAKCAGQQVVPNLPAPGMQEAIVPASSSEALDTVVLRGHCSASAIGIAYMYAKAKTTTLILWDRQHPKAAEDAVKATLRLQQYNVMEEEKPDGVVMGKAFDYFGAGSPKCALIHVGSDKVKQANTMDSPLMDYEKVVRGIEDNHMETLQCFYAVGIYEPWIHAYRATAFIVIPAMLGYDWNDDLCACNVSSRRLVKADPLRIPDGSGWTIGLQLRSDVASVNTKLICGAINSIVLGGDDIKHGLAGKCVSLDTSGAKLS